jgi:hypothetical protein
MVNKALGALVAATGFAAALVAILTAPSRLRSLTFELLLGFAVLLLCVIVGPEALRAYRARRCLPANHELEGLRGFRVEPATNGDIAWIAELEAAVYSKSDAVPEQTLREWFSVNPTGFSIVRDPSGKAIGHLDILPLRPVTMEAFCKGNIVEREIRGDSLYTPTDRSSITTLYVESVILVPEKPMMKGPALLCLLDNLGAILDRIADAKTVEKLYAIAATTAGENLLKKLSFEVESVGERRRDAHGLFVACVANVAARIATLSGSQPSLPHSLHGGL